MKTPWLTVVMPTYNGERFVNAALASIAREPLEGVEVIVIDDASTDGTRDVLDAARLRVPLRILPTEVNAGWVVAANLGMSEARGAWICILHQDDVWMPGRLEALRAAIEQSPGAGIVVGPTVFIDEFGSHIGRWHLPWRGACPDAAEVARRWYVQNWAAVPSVCIRTEVLHSVGSMDDQLWYTADWDLWLRLTRLAPVASTQGLLSGFRVHHSSQTMRGAHDLADFESQMRVVQMRHRWAADGNHDVIAAGEMSTRINVALAGALHGGPIRMSVLGREALRLRPGGWSRFIRDSRVLERTLPRLRLAVRQRRNGRKDSVPAPSATAPVLQHGLEKPKPLVGIDEVG